MIFNETLHGHFTTYNEQPYDDIPAPPVHTIANGAAIKPTTLASKIYFKKKTISNFNVKFNGQNVKIKKNTIRSTFLDNERSVTR